MRPRLKRASRNVGWLSTALPVRGGRRVELTLPLEDLAEVVVRLRVQRVDGDRLPVGLRRVIPLSCRPSSTP